MAIIVDCPGGHTLRIKNEFAGKSGYCPRCGTKLSVPDPRPLSDDDILAIVAGPNLSDSMPDGDDESVFDFPKPTPDASAVSLLGSSKVRGRKVCPSCYHLCSFSFSICPKCGTPLPERGEETAERPTTEPAQTVE